MCINVDVYNIQRARSNTNNRTMGKFEKYLLYTFMKRINAEIDQNSRDGKGSCTVCYQLHSPDIPKEYQLDNISQEFKNTLNQKLTEAGYHVLLDYIPNRDNTINSIRVYIRWI